MAAATQNLKPEDVWEAFYNSFKKYKVFYDFCPHSYLVVRLPFSGLVRIYKTTDVMRSCVHAERDLIKDLRDELSLEEAEEPIKISVYYPTYSTCAVCVQRLADFVKMTNKKNLRVIIHVKVINIVGPEHRRQLKRASEDWQSHRGLKLTSLHCQNNVQTMKYLGKVLAQIVSFTWESSRRVPQLIFLDEDVKNDERVTAFKWVVRGCDPANEDKTNPDYLYFNIPMRQLLHVADQCQYVQQHLESLLNGKDIFKIEHVMDSFINPYITTAHAHDPLLEQVYKELAYIVVRLPHSRRWRVYNSVEPGEHAEQLLVKELREELENMPEGDYIRIDMYLNYLPCCKCLRYDIFPLLQDYPFIKLRIQEYRLEDRFKCEAASDCPFKGDVHDFRDEPWDFGNVHNRERSVGLNHWINKRYYKIQILQNQELFEPFASNGLLQHLVESKDCYGLPLWKGVHF